MPLGDRSPACSEVSDIRALRDCAGPSTRASSSGPGVLGSGVAAGGPSSQDQVKQALCDKCAGRILSSCESDTFQIADARSGFVNGDLT